MKKEFNQIDYIKKYNKTNYKQIKFYLKPEEKEKLDSIMKKNNMKSYREMILSYINELEKSQSSK